MARPKGTDNRSERITLRFTEEELNVISAASSGRGESVSEYVRRQALATDLDLLKAKGESLRREADRIAMVIQQFVEGCQYPTGDSKDAASHLCKVLEYAPRVRSRCWIVALESEASELRGLGIELGPYSSEKMAFEYGLFDQRGFEALKPRYGHFYWGFPDEVEHVVDIKN